MDKKMVGLLSAMAAFAPAAATAATTLTPADLNAESYADLLAPIPNATEKLKASDALLQSDNAAKLEMAQYFYHHHHHHFFHRRFYHHHHHHHFFRRRFHHHHHFY